MRNIVKVRVGSVSEWQLLTFLSVGLGVRRVVVSGLQTGHSS